MATDRYVAKETMAEYPTSEEIMLALTKSGYLLEQQVASFLESLDFHVRTNEPYEDPEEGKSREIDVVAFKRVAEARDKSIAASIEIIVECKNTNSPIVFIGRRKNKADNFKYPSDFLFPIKYEARKPGPGQVTYLKEAPPFRHLGFDKIHYDFLLDYKAVQFCKIERKGGNSWHATHSGLFDLFYPMAKAVQARRNFNTQFLNGSITKNIFVIVPIVVTTGPILYLDSEAAAPQPIEKDLVTFKRDLKSNKFKGNFSIDFVQQRALSAYISSCIDPIVAHLCHLIETETSRLLTADIPWID